MGMKDRSLIDKINLTFIGLTMTAIDYGLSAWKTGECTVLSEFGPGGKAQHMCDTSNIILAVDNACTDVMHRLDTDCSSSSPEVPAKQIDSICSMICRRIHSTGVDRAMAQPHNYQGSCYEDLLDYVPEELIEQPDNSFNRLISFVAATEASV